MRKVDTPRCLYSTLDVLDFLLSARFGLNAGALRPSSPCADPAARTDRRRALSVVVLSLEASDVVLAHRMGVFRVLRLLPGVVGPGVAVGLEGRPTGGAGVAGRVTGGVI